LLFSAPCINVARVIDEIAMWPAFSLNKASAKSGRRLITYFTMLASSR